MSATQRREKLREVRYLYEQKRKQVYELSLLNAELIREIEHLGEIGKTNIRLTSLLRDTTCAICGKQMLDHDEPCEEPC